jgi:hypothetical protein
MKLSTGNTIQKTIIFSSNIIVTKYVNISNTEAQIPVNIQSNPAITTSVYTTLRL